MGHSFAFSLVFLLAFSDVLHTSCVASLPAVVVQSNIFFLKLTDDLESDRKCLSTIGDIFVKIGRILEFKDFWEHFLKC